MTTATPLTTATPHDTITTARPVEQPILLDIASVRLLLDVLGAVALFVSASAAFSVREAAAVTVAVGLFVLAARTLRRFPRRPL